MAFIHCGSEECVKSELDLFQIAPTQTSIEKSVYIEVPPLSALTGSAPLEFFIAGNGEDYLDLNNTLLYVKCKITQEDGTDIAQNARVALVNYPIASIFSQLDVTLGDRLISQSNNCYPYRALIETVLNYSFEILSTQFSSGGFYKDTASLMDSTLLNQGNKGFAKRALLAAESKTVDLLGHLHADIFFQEKLLLNGVDVKIKLARNKDSFCLMSGEGAAVRYKLHMDSAALFVKKVKVAPGVRLAHAEALLTSTAKYPVDRVDMKVFSIPTGARVSNQDNLFLGQLPKMVVMGLVDNDAFSGAFTKNPFHFQHYNINFVALYVDGEQVPSKPFQPDFEAGNNVREYMSLVQTAGKHLQDRPLLVDREEYRHGYTLFAFDLSPDQDCTGHYSLIKTGNLRAEIRFAAALPRTINLIVYGVFDNVIEINHNRNVLFDYM
ncbi:uncharacterized protein F54H12.2-like [Eublepharis macularius]|uniref:Uncharacterized protein F54H12.2-like n=1 Tax=Eublepharis macularius TaxID=481883 RepID=A0AA97L519_EUBMA|nr:uncharacterized protein F54H12.2-like [Eublepharis macularius]